MLLFNPVTVVKPTYRLKPSADYLTVPPKAISGGQLSRLNKTEKLDNKGR